MAEILLVETRDPFEDRGVEQTLQLASQLARDNQVTLLLAENAVNAARESAFTGRLAGLASAGVVLLADDFSLRERGVRLDRLAGGVRPAPIGTVVDHLASGHKVIWH